jgi:hypothetical protein
LLAYVLSKKIAAGDAPTDRSESSMRKAARLVVFNCFYEKLGEITFPNAPGAFPEFISSIQKFKPKGTTFIFGLEDISAYGRSLTVFLTKRKYQVKHVNVALVASERKSRNILHKTDSVDAECPAC